MCPWGTLNPILCSYSLRPCNMASVKTHLIKVIHIMWNFAYCCDFFIVGILYLKELTDIYCSVSLLRFTDYFFSCFLKQRWHRVNRACEAFSLFTTVNLSCRTHWKNYCEIYLKFCFHRRMHTSISHKAQAHDVNNIDSSVGIPWVVELMLMLLSHASPTLPVVKRMAATPSGMTLHLAICPCSTQDQLRTWQWTQSHYQKPLWDSGIKC